jgi:hypothetical protein
MLAQTLHQIQEHEPPGMKVGQESWMGGLYITTKAEQLLLIGLIRPYHARDFQFKKLPAQLKVSHGPIIIISCTLTVDPNGISVMTNSFSEILFLECSITLLPLTKLEKQVKSMF